MMQIKRFEARNMAEAFRNIKQELGPDAVILSAKSLKTPAGIFKNRGRAGVEVMAATDNLIVKSGTAIPYQYVANQYSDRQNQPAKEPTTAKRTRLLQSIGTRISPLTGIRSVKKKDKSKQFIESELHHQVKRRLELNEVDEDIQHEILRYLDSSRKYGSDNWISDIRNRLSDVFDRMGVCSMPKSKISNKQYIIAMIGLTGVGKTTSLVKLVANHILDSDLSVGVISLDVHRVASNSLLNVYAGIMGFDVEYISRINDVKKTLKNLKDRDIIYIDTPGIGLNDQSFCNQLKDLLDKISPDEIHLVMQPYLKKKDAEAMIKKFEMFDFNKLLFTKIDETTVYGAMINLSIFSDTPISYLTFGQNVPEDIDMMVPDKMVELILGNKKLHKMHNGFEKKKYQDLIQNGMSEIGYN